MAEFRYEKKKQPCSRKVGNCRARAVFSANKSSSCAFYSRKVEGNGPLTCRILRFRCVSDYVQSSLPRILHGKHIEEIWLADVEKMGAFQTTLDKA